MQEIKPKNNFASYIVLIVLSVGIGALSGALGSRETILNNMLLAFCMSLALPVINNLTSRLNMTALAVSTMVGAFFGLLYGLVMSNISLPHTPVGCSSMIISGIAYGALIHCVYALRRKCGFIFIETMGLLYITASLAFMLKFTNIIFFREGFILVSGAALTVSLPFIAGWFTVVYLFDPCYFTLIKKKRRIKLREAFLALLLLLFFYGLPKIFEFRFRYNDLLYRSRNNHSEIMKRLPRGTEIYAGYSSLHIKPEKVEKKEFPVDDVLSYSLSDKSLAAKLSNFKDLKIYDRSNYGKAVQTFSYDGYLIVFSPDGKKIAICDNDTVSIHDMKLGKIIQKFKFPSIVKNLCWTKDGKKMVLEDEYRKLFILSLESGDFKHFVDGMEPFLMNDGSIAFYRDNMIMKKSLNKPEKVLFFLPAIKHESLFDFCISPDGKFLCFLYPHNDFSIGSSYVVISDLNDKSATKVVGTVPPNHWDMDIYWVKSLKKM